jgi:hypothetical protein
MTKTTNHADLAEGIERLVREYMSTIPTMVRAAVERAVAAGIGSGVTASTKPRPATGSGVRSRPAERRASDEIAALGERLYEAMCRTPGETMVVLAPIVGATARDLNRPMTLLKRAGRIRSVGARHATRYFPMAPRPSA